MQPEQKPGRSKQDYATPPIFIDAVLKKLGVDRFVFDFAADATNAKASEFWTVEDDSLSKSPDEWARMAGAGYAWLNPPFKKIAPWTVRCVQASALGAQIALLVPAAVGANWYRDHVDGRARVLFLNGRIPFMPDQPTWLYPKDCILALYGAKHYGTYATEVWTWRQTANPARQRKAVA